MLVFCSCDSEQFGFQEQTELSQIFHWNCVASQCLMSVRNPTSFPMSRISSTYNTRKATVELTIPFINTRFVNILFKAIRFDPSIKLYIPGSRCLLQPINGSCKLANPLLVILFNEPLVEPYRYSLQDCR